VATLAQEIDKLQDAIDALKNNKFDRAIALLSDVIAADPKRGEMYAIRGSAYYTQQKYDLAIADFDTAIKLNPKDTASFNQRANSFQKTKQYRKAVDDFKMVEKLDPDDETGVRNNLAWFLATCPDAAARDGKKATESINRSLELHPDNGSVWDTRAAVFAENGEFDNAVSWENRYLDRKDVNEAQRQGALERLALYQKHQAYREEVEKPGQTAQITASTTPAQPGK
jgi:Tetratricopeptide repeat.